MTKEILKSKYGNKDKIIQAHLDYLENLTPVKDLSPSALNELYIDCNRRLQALDALGEKTQSYGRILAPKIFRAFPHEICRNWVVYAKSENLPESGITKLMKFLSEEVEGTITANNIKGSLVPSYPIKSSLENLMCIQDQFGRQTIKKALPKCLPCKLFKAKCGMQIETPLPSKRVVPSAPFTITGIEFAGPVNIRCLKPRDTAYIALFTCATTRALHIELVSDLTTDEFLLALQR
ncbi:integrase catalytic domain-containing protein [Trichonephila clavata]|uniref:Integrase catalytic domain-containing protein n=1 Tax=Trichonephila clavata TaxID=2740835 RepID=A0A8X6KTG3_TRICU|nr:integrase catalytic domain-containing protein [Trichonephila clavata]